VIRNGPNNPHQNSHDRKKYGQRDERVEDVLQGRIVSSIRLVEPLLELRYLRGVVAHEEIRIPENLRVLLEERAQFGIGGKIALVTQEGMIHPQDFPKAREFYELAIAKGNASARIHLEKLSIREAEWAGRFSEALQLQEAFAAKVGEGRASKETRNALINMAWYALRVRNFTKALTLADHAHALFSDDLMVEPNRAHALMFIERGDEAKALYFAHRGQLMSEADNRTWERVITDDFAELRKSGLTHPMMADVEKEFGSSPWR